jgi:hypothetical protein
MRGLRKRLEDLMVAVSFAEAGDDKSVSEILNRKRDRTQKVDRVPATRQVQEERMELKAPSSE